MTITTHSIPRTEYRNGDKETFCTAEPGKVFAHSRSITSIAELEEWIAAVRQAAADAQLPPVKPITERDKKWAEFDELLKKAKGQ